MNEALGQCHLVAPSLEEALSVAVQLSNTATDWLGKLNGRMASNCLMSWGCLSG